MNTVFKKTFNDIYLTKLQWLEMVGLSSTVNWLFLILVMPFNLAGLVLNLISLLILRCKKLKKKRLYPYIMVNVANSLLINILEIFISLPHTYMLSDFVNSPLYSFYFCYIYSPLLNFGTLYSSLIDTCISIERITQFKPRFGILRKQPPFLVSKVLFIVSIFISFQFLFQYEPWAIEVRLDKNKEYRLNLWKFTDYAKTQMGLIITYSTYAFKNVILVAAEIGINIKVVILLRKYIHLRKKIRNKSRIISVKNKTKNKFVHNAIVMLIFMSSLSVLEHVFFLVMTTNFLFSMDETGFYVGIAYNFVLSLKHFSNFIFLFTFKKGFRIVFKKIFNFKIRLPPRRPLNIS